MDYCDCAHAENIKWRWGISTVLLVLDCVAMVLGLYQTEKENVATVVLGVCGITVVFFAEVMMTCAFRAQECADCGGGLDGRTSESKNLRRVAWVTYAIGGALTVAAYLAQFL
jgi:hypothetical protein